MAEQASSRRRWLADSPLGIPAYRQLYTGAVTTSMAYTMQSAMAGWLMAGLSGSALLVGLVQAASTLPFLLFGLVSGSLSDVFDRRYILVFTHLMMGLATAAVGLMAQHGSLQPWSLVACTLLCGLGYTFYQPAQQASINGLVPRPLLPKAVALGSVAFNAARSVGPALAGLIGFDDRQNGMIVWVPLELRFLRTFSRTAPSGHRLRSALERYDHEHGFRVYVAQEAMKRTPETTTPPVVRPIRVPECEWCAWWETCRPRMDDDDISLRISKTPLDVRGA